MLFGKREYQHGGGGGKQWGDDTANVLAGTLGKDQIHGAGADDTITGLGGDDKLFGDDGNDMIDGGADKDKIDGGAGDDILFGGDGRDELTGGLGADVMTGGADRDRFVLGTLDEANGDHVTDYDPSGKDRLDIDWSHFTAGGGTGGDDTGGDDNGGDDTGGDDTGGDDTGGDDNGGDDTGGDDTGGDDGDSQSLVLDGHPVFSGHGHSDGGSGGGSGFSFIGHDAFTDAGQVRVEGADGTWTVYVNVDADLAADYSFTITTVGAVELTAKDFHL